MNLTKQHRYIVHLILSTLIMPCHTRIQAAPSLKELTLYSAGIAATAYLGYLSCSTPQEFTPTVENLCMISAVPIESDTDTDLTILQTPPSSAPSTPHATTAHIVLDTQESIRPQIIHVRDRSYKLQSGSTAVTYAQYEPLWIASCGWDPISDQDLARGINPNVRLAKRYVGRHIIHGPALFIAHNDDRRIFNFGQETDQKNIDFACQLAAGKEVILHGLCRGATAIIGWMQHCENTNTVRAIILESPAVSLKTACHDAGKSFCHSDIAGAFIHKLLAFYYPNYNPHNACKQAEIQPLRIAADVPIFIGNIKQDTVTAENTVTTLVKNLCKKSDNPIYYYICSDETITHARLSKSKEYQQVVNAFLEKYNLPHDAQLATQGQEQLKQAHERALTLKNI